MSFFGLTRFVCQAKADLFNKQEKTNHAIKRTGDSSLATERRFNKFWAIGIGILVKDFLFDQNRVKVGPEFLTPQNIPASKARPIFHLRI